MTVKRRLEDAMACPRCGGPKIRGRACVHCGFDPEHGARHPLNFKIPDLTSFGGGDSHG